VLLGLIALMVFTSWMFINIFLYDAIKAKWCSRYKRHFLRSHPKRIRHDEAVAHDNIRESTGNPKTVEVSDGTSDRSTDNML
jgi:hypothetical protein